MLIHANVKCYLCGHVSGQIQGRPGDRVTVETFQPAVGSDGPRLTRKDSICCSRCGGGVFLDEWDTIRPVEVVKWEPARRGRPRKHPLPAAS